MTDAVRLGRTLQPYPGNHLFANVPCAVERRGKVVKFVVHAVSWILLSTPLPQIPPLSTHIPLSHLVFRVSHRFLRIYRAPRTHLEAMAARAVLGHAVRSCSASQNGARRVRKRAARYLSRRGRAACPRVSLGYYAHRHTIRGREYSRSRRRVRSRASSRARSRSCRQARTRSSASRAHERSSIAQARP